MSNDPVTLNRRPARATVPRGSEVVHSSSGAPRTVEPTNNKEAIMSTEPVALGDALKNVVHALGGDTCREFHGATRGYCGRPAQLGLCDEHRALRARQMDR